MFERPSQASIRIRIHGIEHDPYKEGITRILLH